MTSGELIIISGGPGSGKTTLLEYLKNSDFDTFDEVPRILIERNLQEKSHMLPWKNLSGFARLCYLEMMKQKNNTYPFAFVDRAIGDIIAYLHMGGLSGNEYQQEAVEGYNNLVFLMKPQKEIYIQDDVRPHSFNEALDIHREIVRVYDNLGFRIIEIPFEPVEKQASSILRELGL